MPRPRRRTLSHSEIENFLTEISQVSGENHVNKQAKQAGGDEFPTKHHYSHQYQHRDDDDLSQVNVLMDDDAPVDPTPLPPPTEADLIREYCKMQYRPTQWQAQVSSAITVQQRTVDISKCLHDVCKYKLVSSRLMFPENFPHPSTSIESKKSLLISLSPMLTEAEDQRKQDTKECEEYTRCRSSRGKGRSNYEYIDIDTSLRVEFAEFERRYMMFINRNKVCQSASQDEEMEIEMVSAEELTDNMEITISSDQVHAVKSHHQTESVMIVQQDKGSVSLASSSIQSQGEPEMDVVAMPESESDSLDLSLSLSFERKRSSHGDRKRKHNSAVDRRGTLSPASAKAMLFNAVEEEAVRATHAGNVATRTPPTSPLRTVSSPTSSSSLSLPVSNLNNVNGMNVQPMVDCQQFPAEDDFLGVDNDLFADTASTSNSFGRASNRSHSHISSGSTGGHRYTQRRNTLSPSSAKSLALELIEKEEAEAEARMMAMSEQTSANIVGEASPHISSESESSASESEPESDLLAFQDDTDVDTECSSSTTEDSETESEAESDTMIESERDSESAMDIAEESQQLIHCKDSVIDSKALISEDDSVPVSQLDEILCSSSCNDTENEEQVHSSHEDIHSIISGSVGQDRKHQEIAEDITAVSAMNTDFDELLDEKAVLDALVPSSPTAAFSAFFGRKSEIAEILKIAMNIFEEDEHELTVFEKIENLVVESTSAKQTSVPPAGSINKSMMPVNMYNMEDIPAEMDTDALEAAANRRMKERIVIARNRYLWEVVSAQAANAAIRRMKSKKHSQI